MVLLGTFLVFGDSNIVQQLTSRGCCREPLCPPIVYEVGLDTLGSKGQVHGLTKTVSE